ncbi:hypothetical protein H5410_006319 [Solanum commersonii]|uniref:Uncharacterized protein n=1 Tax=Solanum commersonii TaxID=4109 RepID=A0A9J6A910_SOLCO|nr:hypothetical protein H5410_006319 [Solanum commersonii]
MEHTNTLRSCLLYVGEENDDVHSFARMTMLTRCFLCNEKEENGSHLFLHSSCARQLWSLFISLFGRSCVMLQSVQELLASWGIKGRSRPMNKLWNAIPPCICWVVWWERNFRCFEGKKNPCIDGEI